MSPLWVGMLVSLGVSSVAAPFIYKMLVAMKSRQTVSEHLKEHAHKQGTPTMGGLIVLVGLLAGMVATWQPGFLGAFNLGAWVWVGRVLGRLSDATVEAGITGTGLDAEVGVGDRGLFGRGVFHGVDRSAGGRGVCVYGVVFEQRLQLFGRT